MVGPKETGRSLWPKEHGAYAQLLGPLLVALAHGPRSLPGLAIALAAILAFVAHEPVLVLLGQRGRRALDEDGPRARRWAVLLGASALLLGATGLTFGAELAVAFAAIPLVLGAVLGVLIRLRREKTLLGEILAAIALTSAALPVALASGATTHFALALGFTFALGFTATTVAVRGVIAHAKGRAVLSPTALLAVLTGLVGAAVYLEGPSALGAAPLVASSWVLWLLPPSPRHLRTVGFVLVGATLASGALLLTT